MKNLVILLFSLAMVAGTVIMGDSTAFGSSYVGGYPGMPTSLPTLETSYYDGQMSIAAGEAAGDRTFTNTTVSGVRYIHGDVYFGGAISVSGPAMIVATGNVYINNNTVFGDDLILVNGGFVNGGEGNLGNNVTIGKSCLLYSTLGFKIENDNVFASEVTAGTGTCFITPGYFDLGNNTTFNGLVFAGGPLTLGNNNTFEGILMANYIEKIGPNTTITRNDSLVDFSKIAGFDFGGTSIQGVGAITAEGWRENY